MTLPPEVLETYEVLGRIREGGMGAVYKVRHRHLGVIRVVKVLRPEDRADPELIERFKREARLGGGLSHPNLAQILDLSPDYTWAVMEYVDGVALDDLLRTEGPQPVGLVLEIARQTLSALAYLHGKGSFHRDVSPDNLMLARSDGEGDGRPIVKLIDLGIARSLSGTGRLTAKGMFIGKPRYASPEQAGQSLWIDGRTDLYSLGLVLYELLTGRIPFEAPSVEALLEDRYSREPLGFEVTDPAGRVPPDLRAFLLKALSRRPEERFAFAEEMSRALTAIQARFPLEDGQTVASEPAPVPPAPLYVGPTRQDRPAAPASEAPSPLNAETRRSTRPPEAVTAPAVTRVAAPQLHPQPPRAESRRAPPAPARLPPRPRSRNEKRIAATLAVLFLLAALLYVGWQRFPGWDRGSVGDSAVAPAEVATPAPEPAGTGISKPARNESGAEAAGTLAPASVPEVEPLEKEPEKEPEKPISVPPPAAAPMESPKPEPSLKKEPDRRAGKEEVKAADKPGASREPARPAPAPAAKTVSPTEERRDDEDVLSVPIELPRETPAPGRQKPARTTEWVSASPISVPDVVMPEAALGYEGRVVVKVRVGVDKAGQVTEARALEVTPPDLAPRADFERAAVAAARRARFNPGTDNGVAVASFQVLTFTFEAQ